eukprot:SAG31_NODE_4028_length_3651_cov_36.316160_2_plen_275_part_00
MQDAVVVAAGSVLGLHRLSAAAERAETDGDLWLAGRYWSVASIVVHRSRSTMEAKLPITRALDAIIDCRKKHSGYWSTEMHDDIDEVELQRLCAYGTLLDIPGLNSRLDDINRILVTQAATRDPLNAGLLPLLATGGPAFLEGNISAVADAFYKMNSFFRKTIDDPTTVPDPHIRMLCSMQAYNSDHCLDPLLVREAGFDWEEEVSSNFVAVSVPTDSHITLHSIDSIGGTEYATEATTSSISEQCVVVGSTERRLQSLKLSCERMTLMLYMRS